MVGASNYQIYTSRFIGLLQAPRRRLSIAARRPRLAIALDAELSVSILTIFFSPFESMSKPSMPTGEPTGLATGAPAPEGRILPSHRVASFLVYRLRQVCIGIMSEVVAPAGLTLVEYAALTALDAEPGIDQRRLAARVAIDKMSASQLVERLAKRGLVDRRVEPADRRARVLHLTRKGLALRRRLQPL